MLNLSEITKISEIHLPASPMYLFWTQTVCLKAIRDVSTAFSFAAKAFDKIFRSVFNNEFGLQFLINPLFLFSFFKEFITACSCDVENPLVRFSVIKRF